MLRLGSRAKIATTIAGLVASASPGVWPALGAGASVATAACSSSGPSNGAVVHVAPSILAPRDVLDGAALVSVYVMDVSGDLACDATTGLVTSGGQRVPIAGTTPQLNLTKGNCPSPGASYCGELTVTQSTTDRLFQVAAFSSSGAELGDGCARAKVDGDTLALPLIKLVRFVAPAVCGDGIIEATEQCEKQLATDSAVCDSSCHSVEQLLSNGLDTAGQTQTGDDKSDPSFVWPAANDDSGNFLGLFTDHPSGHSQVGLRVFSADFAPVTDRGATLQNAYIWLPHDDSFPPDEAQGNQSLPAAIFDSGTYYVAFADDANLGSGDGSVDIHVRSMDVSLEPDQAAGAPIGINGPGGVGEANPQTSPAIALGTNGQILVAWTDSASGKIMARTLSTATPPVLGTEIAISSGGANDGVSLAALPSSSGGYLASWISSGDAVVRQLGADGSPKGGVVSVTTGGHASNAQIAALPDGRFAVAYAATGGSNGADIFVQRYSADMTPVAADGTTPVNGTVTAGDQTAPMIAALTSGGGAFAAAWVDGPSGAIQARYIGGSSGYLYNNVDGQDGEFTASIASGRQRDQATLAVGGAGAYVAIGWRDNGPGGTPGIYARRFPLP